MGCGDQLATRLGLAGPAALAGGRAAAEHRQVADQGGVDLERVVRRQPATPEEDRAGEAEEQVEPNQTWMLIR